MDEELEEEAWYNQMEQSARNQSIDCFDELGDSLNWQTRLQISLEHESVASTDQVEEDRYFSDLAYHSKHQALSIIASEDDSIWQHVIRDLMQDSAMNMDALLEVKIEDSSTLLSLQDWLFSFLPKSSKLYVLLSNIINDSCQYKYRIMTNHLSDPSVLVIFYHSKVDAVELSVFSPSFIDEQLFSTICHALQCYRNGAHLIRDIYLSAIDSSLFEKHVADCKDWAIQWTEQCGMFVLNEVAKSAWEELPCGYDLCALKYAPRSVVHKFTSSVSVPLRDTLPLTGKKTRTSWTQIGSIHLTAA